MENYKNRLVEYLRKLEILDSKCNRCEYLGIVCLQLGLFSLKSANLGESIIVIDGEEVMKDSDNINICPVVMGVNTPEEVSAKLRREAEKYR